MICQDGCYPGFCKYPDECGGKGPPPKQTLAEFERLVRDLIAASYNAGQFRRGTGTQDEIKASAALIDYVKRMGVE